MKVLWCLIESCIGLWLHQVLPTTHNQLNFTQHPKINLPKLWLAWVHSGNSGKFAPRESNPLYGSYSSLGVYIPEFKIVRTRTTSCIFSYWSSHRPEPVNSSAVGDRRWLGGTNCGNAKCRRWSHLDQVWQPCMVRGDHPWLPHLVRGDRLWGDHW